ncbi:SDR family NAD(P)-dependent oxidoreductase [Humidesulfovibrio idahonensis]
MHTNDQTTPAAGAVCILGVSSGIGAAMAARFLDRGRTVVGTYRDKARMDKALSPRPGLHLLQCDLGSGDGVACLADSLRGLGLAWDTLFSSVGTMQPIGPFFETDFGQWAHSLQVNAVEQLRALHALYPLRCQGREVSAVFLAGAGTNGPANNYSAYCLSKIMLIKMCELLDAETLDLKAAILGPGWVRTGIHAETLASGALSGENLERTRRFLESDAPGTDMDDIFGCLEWVLRQDRACVGGRNFAVVNDHWHGESEADLLAALAADRDMYKLRRHKNDTALWLHAGDQ